MKFNGSSVNNPIVSLQTKLESRIDILDMELKEGKITKDQHTNTKCKILSEMGFRGKIKSFFIKRTKDGFQINRHN